MVVGVGWVGGGLGWGWLISNIQSNDVRVHFLGASMWIWPSDSQDPQLQMDGKLMAWSDIKRLVG